jgi:hypothetical protein
MFRSDSRKRWYLPTSLHGVSTRNIDRIMFIFVVYLTMLSLAITEQYIASNDRMISE